jgi:hypothetical protein
MVWGLFHWQGVLGEVLQKRGEAIVVGHQEGLQEEIWTHRLLLSGSLRSALL